MIVANKIAIFYHLCQIGNWLEIYPEQICKLQFSGLYDSADSIHIRINGDLQMPFFLDKANMETNSRFDSEIDTLLSLYDFSQKNPDYKILYMHTKGVSYHHTIYGDEKSSHWRKYLEYFCIDRWNECINLLDNYDCVGTEWKSQETEYDGPPHYAGNFWWANASYINKLDVNFLENAPHGRHNSEFWIGTGSPKNYNFFNSNRNLYWYNILRSEYVIGE